jgi:hypothetical protein
VLNSCNNCTMHNRRVTNITPMRYYKASTKHVLEILEYQLNN